MYRGIASGFTAAAWAAGVFVSAPCSAEPLYDMKPVLSRGHPFVTGHWHSVSATPPTPTEQAAAEPTPTRVEPASAATPASAADAEPVFVSVAQAAATPESDDGIKFTDIVSELKAGVLVNDPFKRTESGVNINGEVLFQSPGFFDIIPEIVRPRPHFGGEINTAGDTSKIYAGLSWEFRPWRGLFLAPSFGGAWHDGETSTVVPPDRRSLGCSFLFRSAIEVGWRFGDHHSVSGLLDHISNAGGCKDNEGIEVAGVRYGYRF